MKKIFNAFLSGICLFSANFCVAEEFLCPILKKNELYYYFDWINNQGEKFAAGEWNKKLWRLWINGDTYLTPITEAVITTPLAAYYYPSTNTWYLKCASGDQNIGPRTNVWTYSSCFINKQNTGFECI